MRRLFSFKGGVKPASHKSLSIAKPIGLAPLPAHLIVPLHQNLGGIPRPAVQAGDKVRKGQMIGAADGWISAAVHAPTSGTVVHVGEQAATHPSGLPTVSVVIEPDGEEQWIERHPVDYRGMAPERVRELLRDAGVVGLGGAVFPSHAKLKAAGHTPMQELIINGGECEPFITCDDMLMRERAEGIIQGAAIFHAMLKPQKVLVGIEDNKPEAAAALRQALQNLSGELDPVFVSNCEIICVPTLYPAGGAKQLIRVLTGKEVPAAKRSTDMGVQCFNVATAYSAWRAIVHGEPLISRIVTLSGNVATARNWEVLIGTPIEDLMRLAAPYPDSDGIIVGGPMMGFILPEHSAPVSKATNCLIARSPSLFPPSPPEMPCIRCGECAVACPHELQPFEMYWHARARDFGKAQEYNLFDCIECGCCAYVCPSHIPLVQYFRFAKSEIWSRERDKHLSEGAKQRFDFKQFREERDKAEKAERLNKAAELQAAKLKAEAAAAQPGAATAPASGAVEPTHSEAIAAAIARTQTANSENS